MLRRILFSAAVLLGTSAIVAQADPKDDISAAIQKVADAPNYSWSATTEGGFGGGTTTGKTEKDGFTTVSIPMQDNSVDIVIKGDKAAVKTDDGWKMAADILADQQNGGGGGGFDPTTFAARIATNYKTPIDQAKTWSDGLQNIQKTDDGYSADLSDEAAKQLMTFRRRRPNADQNGDNAGPTFKDLKATLKISIKDGTVSQTELHVTGTMTFNDNDRDIDRTTTTQITDVGSTTVTVPDEVKSKF